jgi:TetR/AcrR family tetracycline transcriptional repressor
MAKRQKTSKKSTGSPEAATAPGLTPAGIVTAALMLIDRDGLESFSLRKLANVLGVNTTAIYWHVPGRNAILAEVVARVIANVSPPPQADWQSYLRLLMGNFRRALQRHPNTAVLLGAQLVSNIAASLDVVEDILAALTQAGFSGTRLVAAYNAVAAAMVGFATQELSPMPEDTAAWQQAVRIRIDNVDAATNPLVAANMTLLANRAFILRWQNGIEAPLDDGFDLFVDAFIAGLAKLSHMHP